MKFIVKTFALSALIFASCATESKKQESESIITSDEQSLIAHAETINEPVESTFYVNAGSGLSLREGTNLQSKKILTLPYGAQVTHLSSPKHTRMKVGGITGEMIEVEYQGATGFAFDGYLTRLAPPLEDESVEAYARRISNITQKVNVKQIPNPKGEDFGMTTTIELPAKNWEEAYGITKRLFDVPKGIQPDFNGHKIEQLFQNPNKRSKTLKDDLRIVRSPEGNLKEVLYSYELKEYKRTVKIEKIENQFLVTEVEVSE